MLEFIGPQSVMFETDFPHPTSLVPGPRSIARTPREHIEEVFGALPVEFAKKVLWENPAKLYGLA
jgi:predicted TIM-barrel fold metal-dependent hydrolase